MWGHNYCWNRLSHTSYAFCSGKQLVISQSNHTLAGTPGSGTSVSMFLYLSPASLRYSGLGAKGAGLCQVITRYVSESIDNRAQMTRTFSTSYVLLVECFVYYMASSSCSSPSPPSTPSASPTPSSSEPPVFEVLPTSAVTFHPLRNLHHVKT